MRALGVAPKLAEFLREVPWVNDWLSTVNERLKVYSGTADPTTSQVPKGQWIVYKNTSLNEVRIWTNDGGVMKKSAAFI